MNYGAVAELLEARAKLFESRYKSQDSGELRDWLAEAAGTIRGAAWAVRQAELGR